MNKYSYIIGDDYINLTNVMTGQSSTVYGEDKNFDKFRDLIIAKDYEAAEAFADVKAAVNKMIAKSASGNIEIKIDDGQLKYSWCGSDWSVFHNALGERIVKMAQGGFDVQPMVNFMGNLFGNPSKQSVDELYMFLEVNNLPITEDGCFIAYKIVQGDYLDIYSKSIVNMPGQYVSVPRNTVDDRRDNTCSTGLHFCSKDYLDSYGSSTRTTDRCVLVKINPADVVSIPSDYNNAKGRCSAYLVVSEVTDDDFRKMLRDRDYTDSPVVNNTGWASPDCSSVYDYWFYDDNGIVFWSDTDRLVARRQHIINKLVDAGISVNVAQAFVAQFEGTTIEDRDTVTERVEMPSEYGYDIDNKYWFHITDRNRPVPRYDVIVDSGMSMTDLLNIEEHFSK